VWAGSPRCSGDDGGTADRLISSLLGPNRPAVVARPAVTAPDSFGCANRITAENNPATAPTLFVTVDVFTNSTASRFGGDVIVSNLTSTTLTGTVGYSDGAHDVDGTFSAVLR